ncbi:MAG: MoaD/ThiS family protein [Novosphingobium sp.]|nr:MoaD/ThiS family protein [Novosphingobium sp.]
MSLKLVFLGRLEDAAGAPELTAPLPQPATLSALLGSLPPTVAEAVSGGRVKLALNGRIVPCSADTPLSDGDELAFLPPVSGG